MNHIGRIIEEYRHMVNMTRKELSEDICTENYVYLIEKGSRSPSSDMLRMFSGKLGVNLCYYYPFIDCSEPIKVCEVIQKLTECQRITDFKTARKIVSTAMKLPDFKRRPWFYILEANRLACKAFDEQKYQEVISEANGLLQKAEPQYANTIFTLNLYVVLSACYQISGDMANAETFALKAYHTDYNKHDVEHYDHLIISTTITLMTLYYHMKEFDKAICKGEELALFQHKSNSYGRIHFTYAYLAFAYYQAGNENKAFSYFDKAILLLLAHPNPVDVHYIACQDVFHVLAKDRRMNQDRMREFNSVYHLGEA